jgi:ribosome-binding factor A
MSQESGRGLRIADFIRDEVADILQRQMRDPRVGMLSVNDVRVSRDLSYADIYVSSLDTPPEQRAELITVLNNAAGFVRTELAKRHSMRTTPKPRFRYDEIAEEGPRLERLIEYAVKSDDAQRSASGKEDADG